MQKILDLSIKKHETGTLEGGYSILGRTPYQSYMNNQDWSEFKKDMEQNHPKAFEEYGAGSGGELKEKGNYPPKMASYGSSSRMIYNLCKDSVQSFHFEYKLPTRVGGTANLDGFMEKDDKYIFVEAKCREPYGAKSHLIEGTYKELYQYINKYQGCNLSIQTEDTESKMKVVFSVGDNIISSFDIKQMICHLLGIAMKFLNEPTDKAISFLYLCYNPNLIEIIDAKKCSAIYATYDQMCAECHSIDFSKLFESIVKYLREKINVGVATNENVAVMLANFDFALCDQSNFLKHLS